ncbi:alpha/beta fold hydrolase [Rhodococcus maanshanensis]|uniref:Pimeloyl-ACP methyl ester carboxylesterase n=1 Tax=Rhodococcus maanshanensis TaxID=183556 RepID=A0A1H7JGT1_9NOCA|nr:alpha/beta hydrolase [Rhodococcus maanshanensis]SEK73200.1 Pimeloyl-ACP methyl ester carboxylesterase [Rhodococcus maanshanensis]
MNVGSRTGTRSGSLRVEGASLYFEVRGAGPVLLISQSGEGDAGRSRDLVDRLEADYTVVTYDRRGLSRSVLDDPDGGVTLAQHADDVHRLLAEVTDEPARMLGCSLGASIGLHVAVGHPEQLATLVAHEPVSPRLLPPGHRAEHQDELAEIQRVHRTDGLAGTLQLVAKVLGIDPHSTEVEPGLTPMPMSPQRIRNFDFFVEQDFSAIIRDTLDVAAVGRTSTRIVPAVGRATPETVFDRACAVALADLRGEEVRVFPGGHNGNTSHPSAYAEALRAALN